MNPFITDLIYQIRSVDMVVDAGDSLNPAIDIGQVEGAYVQGYGNLTMEELLFSPQGNLRTQGPYTYKLPSKILNTNVRIATVAKSDNVYVPFNILLLILNYHN